MGGFLRIIARLGVAAAVALALAAPASAHVVKQIGPYSVAIGWLREPTYVGIPNAVQVVIKDARGNPVTDLTGDDLKVVISTAGKQSDQMALQPSYDEDTGLGIKGDYEASIIPTAPGDYTFHVTGAIHGQKVDETVTSSESTFDTVVESTAVQFPDQLPALGDVVTRITQVDDRATSAGSAAATAETAATDARSAATTALWVGAGTGVVGLAVAIAALVVALRRRPATG